MERKKILILGATSDMAMATGREFAKNGYDLLLAARNNQRLEPYALDIKNRYEVDAKLIEFNASGFDQHDKVVESLPEDCEVVLCAFGYLGDQKEAEHSWDESKRIIDGNYTGAVSILNHIAEKWKPREMGTIIGISSVAGDRGRSSNYIYGSAKAAFTAYLAGLRNSLYHHNIHVMTVNPGFVSSKMTSHLDLPASLTSTPEEVGQTIYKGFKKRRNMIYISPVWRLIMTIIKFIPEPVFKRLKM